MKYSITIDTNSNEITADVVCPRFLRTGSETQEELARRRNCIGEWARAKTPDWLQDTVDYLQDRLNQEKTV